MLSCGKSWPWIVTLYFLSLILFLIDSLLWLDFFVIFSLCDTNDFHAYYHASKIYKYTLPAMIKAIPGKEKHSNFEVLAWSDWVALRNFLLNPLRYFFFWNWLWETVSVNIFKNVWIEKEISQSFPVHCSQVPHLRTKLKLGNIFMMILQ